jgi:hypothetical protein
MSWPRTSSRLHEQHFHHDHTGLPVAVWSTWMWLPRQDTRRSRPAVLDVVGHLRRRDVAVPDARGGALRAADDARLDERVEVGAANADATADVQSGELPLLDPVPNRLLGSASGWTRRRQRS